MGLITLGLYCFFIFTLMIIFHEAGHVLMLKYWGVKDIKYGFLEVHYKSNLKNSRKQGVLLFGIALGLLPLLFLIEVSFIAFLGLLTAYTIMCKPDLKRYMELDK